MNTTGDTKLERWHEPEIIKELRDSFEFGEDSPNYLEIESNSEKMDEYLDKFLDFKKLRMKQSSKSYGIYSYKRLSTSNQHTLEYNDKKLSGFITKLEERELVLKASVSSIPPEILHTLVSKRDILDTSKECEIFGDKEPHTFAMSFGLENVKDRLSSPEEDLVSYIDSSGTKRHTSYKEYLIDAFGVAIDPSLAEETQIDILLNGIKDSLRDSAGILVKNHSGIRATTTNSHVTGVMSDTAENSQEGLKIYLLDSLNKLHPDNKYDLKNAGKDIMIAFGATKQNASLVKLTDESLVVAYATNEGNITQVNNAISYEKVFKALDYANGKDLMSPFVIVDTVDNLGVDSSKGIFQVENKAKRTKFAVKPVELSEDIITTENRFKVEQRSVESSIAYTMDLDIKTLRELQKYRVGFLSGEEIQIIAEARLKGKPISELVQTLEDTTAISHISFGISGIEDLEETEQVSSIMSDISGYSLASEILKEFDMDASNVFIPMLSDIAGFVENTGGLQDNFAGDSINIIYTSTKDMQTLRGDAYKFSAFEMLSPSQKSFYAEIGIHILKDTYEKKMASLIADTEYLTLVTSIESFTLGEETLDAENSIKLQQVKSMLKNESNKEKRLAMSYYYVSLIARLRGGKLDLKSLSALSDCSIELVGPTSFKMAHDASDQSNSHTITHTETLKTGKFDKDRYILENVARRNAIVMDAPSFDKLRNPLTTNEISLDIDSLFTKVIDDSTGMEVYVLNLEDAKKNESVVSTLKSIGITEF